MPNQEHKSVESTVDGFFDKLDAPETTQETAPEVAQPETPGTEVEAAPGNVPAKTSNAPETPEDFSGVPKGFQNHPAWQKREAKLKEAEERLKQYETEKASLFNLLDDPLVYRKYLKNQGLSEEQIKAYFREQGIEEEKEAPVFTQAEKNDLAESICKKLGWDMARLNPEQATYLKDQVKLSEAIFEEKLKGIEAKFESRLKPLEGLRAKTENQQKMEADFHNVEKMAREEFAEQFKSDPDYFKKVIEPAMHQVLDYYDAKKLPNPDVQTLYEKATRLLFKEQIEAKGRQEVRDEKKGNARPLTPGNNIPAVKNAVKGKNVSETIDNVLNSVGFKG